MQADGVLSMEANPTSFSSVKDLALGIVFGTEFLSPAVSNLYELSISKTFGASNFSLRYSPGYNKEFSLLKNQSVIGQDSSDVSLKTSLKYSETFAAGFSYKYSEHLSSGFTLHYFTENFSQDAIGAVFSDSSLTLIRENNTESMSFINFQFGGDYQFSDNYRVSMSGSNFIKIKNGSLSDINRSFEMKTPENIRIAFYAKPYDGLGANIVFETIRAFQISVQKEIQLFGLYSSLSCSYFGGLSSRGVQPSLSLRYGNLSADVTALLYTSQKQKTGSLNDLTSSGISSILNNKYCGNKAVLQLSYRLQTTQEKFVQFVDVSVTRAIFPMFSDLFLDAPFAIAKVVNISDKAVTVKPGSKIDKLNNEIVYSPSVVIAPKDTVSIPFYTAFPETYFSSKHELSFVTFSLITENADADDNLQKPLLINSSNAWDGEVGHLHYFVKKDFDYSSTAAKRILSKYKNTLDTTSSALLLFQQAKLLFNEIIPEMLYVADPVASNDRVQFPHETIDVKGGDCDDFSVCLASFYESIGIETAFVDYRGNDQSRHVNLLFNTGLHPSEAQLITRNDKKYFIRKDTAGEEKVWIPIETTERSNFTSAWEKGVEIFTNEALDNLGLVKGTVQIIEIY